MCIRLISASSSFGKQNAVPVPDAVKNKKTGSRLKGSLVELSWVEFDRALWSLLRLNSTGDTAKCSESQNLPQLDQLSWDQSINQSINQSIGLWSQRPTGLNQLSWVELSPVRRCDQGFTAPQYIHSLDTWSTQLAVFRRITIVRRNNQHESRWRRRRHYYVLITHSAASALQRLIINHRHRRHPYHYYQQWIHNHFYRTMLRIPRTMLSQDVCPTVCPSVCLYVRHTPAFYQNCYRHHQTLSPSGSHVILVFKRLTLL